MTKLKNQKFVPEWLSKSDKIGVTRHEQQQKLLDRMWKTVENLETNTESQKTKFTDKKYGEICAAA